MIFKKGGGFIAVMVAVVVLSLVVVVLMRSSVGDGTEDAGHFNQADKAKNLLEERHNNLYQDQ